MQVVLEADTSAVFLADLQTVSGIPKVQQLWRSTTNAPAEYIDKHIAKGLTVSVRCTMQAKINCEGEFFCLMQVQSAGFTGWLAPLWRAAACLFLTILGFFKVEYLMQKKKQLKYCFSAGPRL